MGDFLLKYWFEITLSLITAGALGLCKYALNQIKNYKKLLDQQDEKEIINIVKEELKPIKKSIQDLSNNVNEISTNHEKQLKAIIRVYRFKLVSLCIDYLDQGYMTSSQFESLSEFYKSYHDLGGNGQAKEYYEKAKALPIKDE